MDRLALGALVAFTLSALAGYWAFALHPQWLPQDETALKFYSISFRFFAQIQIFLAALVLAVPLIRRARLAWVAGFAGVFLVSFTSEFVGTGYGIPFGGYSYTALLGAKLGGRVPALIPVSWFLMALPSFVLAHAAFARHSAWVKLTMASILLVIWDLALDPAMSFLTPYWLWEETGPYYGMPWMNLLGWFVTGLALMGILSATGGRRWSEWVDVRFALVYYGAVLLMPLGMVVAAGEWLAVFTTLAALGAWAGAARLTGDPAMVRRPGVSSGSPDHAPEPAAPATPATPLPSLRVGG
jgi:putative membrane protein